MHYGYEEEVVKKLNEDAPHALILTAQFPTRDVVQEMKEKHPELSHFEIPIIFKNYFQYECLLDDYFADCSDEIIHYLCTTYDVKDGSGDLCDCFDPSMMEPDRGWAFETDIKVACVDLRTFQYSSEEQPE